MAKLSTLLLDFFKVTIECSSIYSFTQITEEIVIAMLTKASDIKSIDFLFKIQEKVSPNRMRLKLVYGIPCKINILLVLK